MSEPSHFLLKCISGSKAYNLDGPASDTDLRGIFIQPRTELYGLNYTPQVSNATNDETFFEIGRLIELLLKNNPAVMELLATPRAQVLFRHPVMDLLNPQAFLSKRCKETFAGYAKTQMQKARGLNKKMNVPEAPVRKGILDFCWVYADAKTTALNEWLREHSVDQKNCGLTALAHFRDCYKLFLQKDMPGGCRLNGIERTEESNDVQTSIVPPEAEPAGLLYFNKDGYSMHCREYREYNEWLDKRNESRYQNNKAHGQQYDSKNMMHTIRLLNMAEEIARFKEIRVFRSDRDFLLGIKAGNYSFDALVDMVNEKLSLVDTLYERSDLPDEPDERLAEQLLVRMREEFYQ
ncbi:nucleotidyltransferase domain-containing protein [Nostoc ellipsosporum NOK]|nr:nucleotidyltransferase domain-containing protein [Nostoc ellipsosporum NOK]